MDELVVRLLSRSYRATARVMAWWEGLGSLAGPVSKAVIFALLLFWVQQSSFSFWSTTLFTIAALLFYMQPVHKPFILKGSLILILTTALLLTSRFTIVLPIEFHAGIYGQLLFALVFAFLFFTLLAVKNGVIVRRREWQMVLFVGLIYSVNLLFFTALTASSGWGIGLIFVLCTYFLCYEYLSSHEECARRPIVAASAVFTLLLLELGWSASLLPLGFSKAASMLSLIAVIMIGAFDRYQRGALTAQWLRMSFVIFCLLIGLLFWSIRWTV